MTVSEKYPKRQVICILIALIMLAVGFFGEKSTSNTVFLSILIIVESVLFYPIFKDKITGELK